MTTTPMKPINQIKPYTFTPVEVIPLIFIRVFVEKVINLIISSSFFLLFSLIFVPSLFSHLILVWRDFFFLTFLIKYLIIRELRNFTDRRVLSLIMKCHNILPSALYTILHAIFEKEHLDRECMRLLLLSFSRFSLLSLAIKATYNISGPSPFLFLPKFLIGLTMNI